MSEITIKQVIAIDDDGDFIGIYAVDGKNPELPGVIHKELVDFPETPLPSGKFIIVPVDPEFPNGETMELELLDWPGSGWKFINNSWLPPN